MGNIFSLHRRRGAEKHRIREQINELSVMLYSLQQELACQKTKSDDKDMQIEDAAKDHAKDIRTCNERIAVIREIMERTFGKLENDIQNYKARVEQIKIGFEDDKKQFYKLVDVQEQFGKELSKCLKNIEEDKVSTEEFSALQIAFEKMRRRMECERDAVPQTVRKYVKERSSEWEKEILEIAEKFQETRGFMMELITLDLGHERDIVGMKYRIDKLEECTSRTSGSERSSGEFLPNPSLPDVERLKSVSSEAPSIKNPPAKAESEMENYQLKMSKISAVMKRMKEELHKV